MILCTREGIRLFDQKPLAVCIRLGEAVQQEENFVFQSLANRLNQVCLILSRSSLSLQVQRNTSPTGLLKRNINKEEILSLIFQGSLDRLTADITVGKCTEL